MKKGQTLLLLFLALVMTPSNASYAFSDYIKSTDVDFVIYSAEGGRLLKVRSDQDKTELAPEEALQLATEDFNRLADAVTVDNLANFLWHNQGLDDPPASYNNVIALYKRAIEIDPAYKQQYFVAAWLLYSKWAVWNRDPERMPDGENKMTAAIEVLGQGSEEFRDSAPYHYRAALTLNTPYDVPEQHEFVEKMLRKADALAGEEEEELKIRARLTLGVYFKRRGRQEEAEKWFRKTLELDPAHEPASRYLQELE